MLLAPVDDQELLLSSRKPNHLVFLARSPAIMLVADVSIAAISDEVATVAKTLNRP
jgi:hypothetical protein